MTIPPGDRPTRNPRATRSVVMGRRGLIATSQPLASADGLQVLAEGGNAIDAAVTAAATLSVVEPTMTGIGGDLFAIVRDGRTGGIHGLNASGRSPAAATLDALGDGPMPNHGIRSVSVPGAVDGWHELLRRHGTITLARALAPAIEHAREGFAVTEIVARQWRAAETRLAADPATARTFLADGRAPVTGTVFRNPQLAATLEQISEGGRDAFYRGPTAQAIASDARARGGWLTADDLAAHRSDWIEPLRTTFRGHEVLELPPNTQGLAALEVLNLLERDDLADRGHNTAAYLHTVIEAIRIAFADRDAHIADPAAVAPEIVEHLVSKGYAAARRDEIDPRRAATRYDAWRARDRTVPAPTRQGAGDTVYLTAADRDGHVVSLIQSLFEAFGAGIVAGDTGVALQNRAALFSVDPGHPNALAPRKRPFHTLAPAMVLRDGRPWLSYGVMGGDMQIQGHVQVLLNLLLFGMNVQEAGEAARVRWNGDGVAAETGVPTETRDGLLARGHHLLEVDAGSGGFGGFQGILIDHERGVLMGGSDPRKDGLAIGR
jgi:gamma-glutamyltranspeptidase/glutathione hydrolase